MTIAPSDVLSITAYQTTRQAIEARALSECGGQRLSTLGSGAFAVLPAMWSSLRPRLRSRSRQRRITVAHSPTLSVTYDQGSIVFVPSGQQLEVKARIYDHDTNTAVNGLVYLACDREPEISSWDTPREGFVGIPSQRLTSVRSAGLRDELAKISDLAQREWSEAMQALVADMNTNITVRRWGGRLDGVDIDSLRADAWNEMTEALVNKAHKNTDAASADIRYESLWRGVRRNLKKAQDRSTLIPPEARRHIKSVAYFLGLEAGRRFSRPIAPMVLDWARTPHSTQNPNDPTPSPLELSRIYRLIHAARASTQSSGGHANYHIEREWVAEMLPRLDPLDFCDRLWVFTREARTRRVDPSTGEPLDSANATQSAKIEANFTHERFFASTEERFDDAPTFERMAQSGPEVDESAEYHAVISWFVDKVSSTSGDTSELFDTIRSQSLVAQRSTLVRSLIEQIGIDSPRRQDRFFESVRSECPDAWDGDSFDPAALTVAGLDAAYDIAVA